ncbi:FAST kinase domain-containing protein 3, mitochondrial-like [Amblyomma americanum]
MSLTATTRSKVRCLNRAVWRQLGTRTLTSHYGIRTSATNLYLQCSERNCAQLQRTHLRSLFSLRNYSSRNGADRVTKSTIILQDGVSIEELPVLIKKATAESLLDSDRPVHRRINEQPGATGAGASPKVSAIIKKCASIKDVYIALRKVDPKDLTPAIGVEALDKLLQVRDIGPDARPKRSKSPGPDGVSLVIGELCNLITTAGSSEVILDGLRCVVRHRYSEEDRKRYVDTFVHVILSRICDGTIRLPDILEATLLLVSCGSQYLNTVDHFWQSIVTQAVDMEKEDVLKLYSLLPYFKSSQSVVLRAVARNTTKNVLSFGAEDVAYILSVLTRLKLVPQTLLLSLTKWMNLNLHIIPEKEFSSMVRCLQDLRYLDANSSKAVERYIRIKGSASTEETMDALALYCQAFRWRSEPVFNSVSDYFVANHKVVSLPAAVNMVRALGYLNIVPRNAMEFFGSLEWLLREKFSHIPSNQLVDMLVACFYLQRYPLNFVKKVFSPHFLDKMNGSLEQNELRRTHQKLKFLDSALTLECQQYHGPYLPRDYSSKSIRRDGRLLRLMCSLQDDMESVVGGEGNFSFSVVQPKLPLSDMYIIDYVVKLNKQGKPMAADAVSGVDKRLAVIIALPEHYCMDNLHATGNHATKMRLLRTLGYTVIELSYDLLQKTRPASKERLNYLSAKILSSS